MMTHAYSAAYLSNAKELLSSFFDYAINDCKLKPDWITALFVNTGYAKQFERGNPAYIAGMSGVELARAVIVKAYGSRELPPPTNTEDYSPAYWAGCNCRISMVLRPQVQRHLCTHPFDKDYRYVFRISRNGYYEFHRRHGSVLQNCGGRF